MSHHKEKSVQNRGIDLRRLEKPSEGMLNLVSVLCFSQGKETETVKCLEEFMKTAEDSQLRQSLVDACVLLGNIYHERVSTTCSKDSNSWV